MRSIAERMQPERRAESAARLKPRVVTSATDRGGEQGRNEAANGGLSNGIAVAALLLLLSLRCTAAARRSSRPCPLTSTTTARIQNCDPAEINPVLSL